MTNVSTFGSSGNGFEIRVAVSRTIVKTVVNTGLTDGRCKPHANETDTLVQCLPLTFLPIPVCIVHMLHPSFSGGQPLPLSLSSRYCQLRCISVLSQWSIYSQWSVSVFE